MMLEMGDVWLNIRRGSTDIFTCTPQECPSCHRMSIFFTNKQGETKCTGCEGKK